MSALAAKNFDLLVPTAEAASPNIVISQVYGGGGNSGAPLTHDFIELFNRGTTAVSINGWSVQYTSATGTGNFGASDTLITELPNVSIAPGQYFLIQEASQAAVGSPLPTPDVVDATPIALSGTNGKVALVNTLTPLGCNGGSSPCSAAALATIVDLVGYGTANFFEGTGAAPALSNTTAALRDGGGCVDTDDNSADFANATTPVSPGAPNPRNTASTVNPCGGGGDPVTPVLTVSDVTKAEGNTGTTNFDFIVNLSAPAPTGGVTFDIATQDGSATVAGSDYVARSLTGQSIAAGASSYTFTVTVNGDTLSEPNEDFFVNVTNVSAGVTVSDAQGRGTITNDEVTAIPIHTIQGSGTASPFVDTAASTSGIVTLLKSDGFFLQAPDSEVDADANTSEGIYVLTTSAPSVSVGNSVTVSGTVREFFRLTEIAANSSNIFVNSAGNPLPSAIALTPEILNPAGTFDQLEKFEGMRLFASSLTTVSPNDNFGDFFTVLTGQPRPFREPGIERSSTRPAGTPEGVPTFDENPEKLVVDSNGRIGSSATVVTSNVSLTNVAGSLDFTFSAYRLIPESPLSPSPNMTAIPVPTPTADEFTIGNFNIENFANSATQRLKASLAIRNVMRYPDIIGHEEIMELSGLQALATQINNDAVAAGDPNPNYVAYLQEADGQSGDSDIDVGFLVKTTRVNVVAVTQFGANETFTNPNTGQQDLTNDRPPLVLDATINRTGLSPLPVKVIVNHLRSLICINAETPSANCDPQFPDGPRVRAKRKAGAEYLANLIQNFQTADPNVNLISVGDYNAFQFSDGYVDVIGTIKGTPAPADQVVLASPDLVNPDLINLTDTLPAERRYSFVFNGNAQALDHILVNINANARLTRYAVGRVDADFPNAFRSDSTRPERVSDHDTPVAFFTLNAAPVAPAPVLISEFRFNGPNGTGDEFIELYNNTDVAVNVQGWTISAPAGTGGGGIVIGGGGVIAPRGHYLVAPSDYSASGYPAGVGATATPDEPYAGAAFPDDGGARLADTNGNVIDMVGFSSSTAVNFREGTGLLPAGGVSPSGSEQFSFVRRMTSGLPQDTNNNVLDFVLVSNTGAVGSEVALLGAPGPENTSSPVQRNGLIKASLIDNCSGIGEPSAGCQNRVRDASTSNPATAQFGTLSIRRKFTNTGAQSVTRLRFRLVDITTLNSPGYALNNGQADLRVLTSFDTLVTPSNPFTPGDDSAITVRGTVLEEPPTQSLGGGHNSTVTVDLPQPLPGGQSVTVQFLLGVQQNGIYRFFVNVEALGSDAVTPTKTRVGKKTAR
ncbi:MAG: lamin tail domain-containing protein [Pyrinomonadaceae bacterium]